MSSIQMKLGRLYQCTFEQALELRNRGFEGYFSDMQTTMDRLLVNFGTHGIRPELSVVAFVDEKPVGFVFIATKVINGQKLAWNGGTGVIPEYRGKGIAKAMMLEKSRVIGEQDVDKALLEVVTKNAPAIAAYQKGGFHIVDHLIGMNHEGPLKTPLYEGDRPADWQFICGKPADVKDLSFYREQVAWECMWHNMREGASLILRNASGQVIAYALFTRNDDEAGQVKSIVLHQCEVHPEREDRERLFRIMLNEVYGACDLVCTRSTNNLSMANPEVVTLLEQEGFNIKYKQYLMMMEKESGEESGEY